MTQHSVCIITENLSLPADEGVKKFARSLFASIPPEHKLLGAAVRSDEKSDLRGVVSLNANKLLLDARLRVLLKKFQPDVVYYVPTASATLFSFLRSKMLKLFCPSAQVVMISMQPRNMTWLAGRLVRLLSPDKVLVQHEPSMERLRSLGCDTGLVTSGVDLKTFTPVTESRKRELRAKYGLDPAAFTVLHVGHLTSSRNVQLLKDVRREQDAQVVLVSSGRSYDDKQALGDELKASGVIVMDGYIPDVQELYQLADCYLFPVFSERACIGVPLSILEAMACNVPVVSVRYGRMPDLFPEDECLAYADTPAELLENIGKAKDLHECRNRGKVARYSWDTVAGDILDVTFGKELVHG